MKILLLNLPRESEVRDVATPDYLLYDFMNYPPLGLLAIASGIDPRHSVQVLDTPTRNMSIKEVIAHIKQIKPDLLGISVVTRRLYGMFAVTKAVKKDLPEVTIVVGGPHVNVFPKETMELGTVDFALPGYGELRFPQLVEALARKEDTEKLLETIPGLLYKKVNGQIHIHPPAETPVNLDDLPFPNRKLINLDEYFSAADRQKMTTMYTSRGCPFRCVFCDVGEKVFRYRSPEKIVDEFESIKSMGVQEIHIFDDTFNVSRQRVIDMCGEILKRGLKINWSARVRVVPFDREMASLMKQAGCKRLHVGVEAFDDDILRKIKKNTTTAQINTFFSLCNEFKIDTLAYFIVGFPQETQEYRDTLFRKLKQLKARYLYLNVLYPTAKSEYYADLLRSGIYQRDYWQDFITNPVPDFELPLCRDAGLQEELIRLVDDIHRKFYLSPRFIMGELKRSTNLRMLGIKSRIAVKLFKKTVSDRMRLFRNNG